MCIVTIKRDFMCMLKRGLNKALTSNVVLNVFNKAVDNYFHHLKLMVLEPVFSNLCRRCILNHFLAQIWWMLFVLLFWKKSVREMFKSHVKTHFLSCCNPFFFFKSPISQTLTGPVWTWVPWCASSARASTGTWARTCLACVPWTWTTGRWSSAWWWPQSVTRWPTACGRPTLRDASNPGRTPPGRTILDSMTAQQRHWWCWRCV